MKRLITPSAQTSLHTITFLVAFCSFTYELAYSELLTVMYGGTVTQYGLTIGIFFSSLGIGSYIAKQFDETRPENVFRTELYLAFIAPVGLLFIIWINTAALPQLLPEILLGLLARLPVVGIGVLSGFELPLLLALVNNLDSPSLSPGVRRITNMTDRVINTIIGILFHTSHSRSEYDTYSTVLAMDYLGGLISALIYVFLLYPSVGLIISIFALALINVVAALFFICRFSSRPWGILAEGDRDIITNERTVLVVITIVLTATLGGAVISHQTVDNTLTEYYLEGNIEQEYPPGTVDAEITTQFTTQYQHVVQYNRTWKGNSSNPLFAGQTERCLRLDTAIQVCDSTARPYHNGLVDVPLSMYPNTTDTDVLLVGGGDWIALDHLRQENVSVDHVDIDAEFMQYAKTNSFLTEYHNNAYTYEHAKTYQADIYDYLQRTDAQYDVILLDLPGAKTDDLLPVYSTQFYRLLKDSLTENGVVATWGYSQYTYSSHQKAYFNTVTQAGFTQYQSYYAYDDYTGNGETRRGELFYLFAPDSSRPVITPTNGTQYVRKYQGQYQSKKWRSVPTYRGVRPNTLFNPNYEILIDTQRKQESASNRLSRLQNMTLSDLL